MKGLLSIALMFLATAVFAVTLDALVPGKGYESLTVAGTAETATVEVKLVDRTDLSKPPITHSGVVVTEGRFTDKFASLAPGHLYEVYVNDERKDALTMSRDMTNGWIDEDAETFVGHAPGTGIWTGDGEAEILDSRIIISAEVNQDHERSVIFLPTNHFGAATGYRVNANLSFEGEAQSPRTTDAIFGVTLVIDPNDNSRAVFYIIDNLGWVRTDHVGSIGIKYDMEFVIDEVNRTVNYYLINADGRLHLGTGEIPAGSPTRFRSVDFQGFGSLSEIYGDAFDTKQVSAEVHFDGEMSNGVFRAGMNFTNLVLNGWISITNLWETGVTNGTFEIRVIGPDGQVRKAVTNDWSGFSGVYGITNLVDGLSIGDTYTIEVKVLDDTGSSEMIAGDGDWSSRGIMGRMTDAYYDEDGYTVSKRIPATGIWTVESGITLTVGTNNVVNVVTDGTAEDAKAIFAPTNSAPRNGYSCVHSFEVSFPSAMEANDFSALPDPSTQLFGITLIDQAGKTKLAVIVDGVWQAVESEVFKAEPGRVYLIDVVCGQTPTNGSTIDYYVTDEAGIVRLIKQGGYRAGSKPYPSEIVFRGDGRFASAIGTFFDTTLMDVELELDDTPGTNFTAVAVSGTIRITPTWETDCSNGTIKVVIRNGRGEIVATNTAEFSGNSPIDISVEGLEPGESYSVSAYVIDTDGPADGDVEEENILTPTAKEYTGEWIYEDADTLAGIKGGTGDWHYRLRPTPEAKAADDTLLGRAIQIESDLSSSVIFESTNTSPAVVNSTLREIKFVVCSEAAGYSLSSPEFPKMRPADLAGVTIVCDDLTDGRLYFSVYNPAGDGSWVMLSNTVAELNRAYTFAVIITYSNPNKTTPSSIAYYIENAEGKRDRIAFFEPGARANGEPVIPEVSDSYRTRLRFVGSGAVKYFKGVCYDAHLADIDGLEYWTIADAIREIGTSGRVLTPLWLSTYTADMNEGWFGVRDPNHWLRIIWPLGYVVEITDSGDVRFYLFHLSDYWIDWADVNDVANVDGVWEVKSANGLAWLARESTNRWMTGDITLTDDITNLYEHIWTPIRGFTGTFDGNNHSITGLTDKGVAVCLTNTLPMTVYGLFGSASNSVFRNVAFEGVAVTNDADAVASLLGCSLGDLVVTNVAVRSGQLIGGGQFVAGIVGYIGDYDKIDLSRNFNAATIIADNAPLGGVNASGIANLGLDSDVPGAISVVGNENRGAIESTINSAIGGGNLAQILAGSESEALFDPDKVVVKGNIGTGDVSRVISLNHDGCSLASLPIVNLSAEVSRQSDDEDYKEFIEANDSTDVLIDPWRLTARMTGAFYQNGDTNFAGRVNDQITASKSGKVVTLQESTTIWSPIVLDRPIILELDGKILDNVFSNYTFKVTADAGGAVVRNGTVTHPVNMLATRPEGDQWSMVNVTKLPWNCNYWERTLNVNGDFVDSVSLPMMMQLMSAGAYVTTPEDSAYSIDASKGTLNINGEKFVSFSRLGYTVREEKDGEDSIYIIEIDDDPAVAPEINFVLSPNGGTSTVTVKGAKANCEYCLQSVSSLAESWDKVDDRWVSVGNDGDELVFEVDTSGESRFYRIKVQKK